MDSTQSSHPLRIYRLLQYFEMYIKQLLVFSFSPSIILKLPSSLPFLFLSLIIYLLPFLLEIVY